MGYRLIVIVIIISAALAAAACSATVPAVTEPATTDGVDASLLRELQAELDRQLAARGTTAVRSVDDEAFRVTDFTLANFDAETETLTFTWSTAQVSGDYDLNGEVNGSDLGPIAKYYRRTSSSPDWERARYADGDGNGEVNGGDITAISGNFGTAVHGFFFSPEFHDYSGNGDVTVADIHPIGAHMLRPNPGTEVLGPLFDRSGTYPTGPWTVRNESELPYQYLGLYGFPMKTGGTAPDGRLHYSAQIGYVDRVPSIYFMVAPYRGISNPVDDNHAYDIGQFSEEIKFDVPAAQ